MRQGYGWEKGPYLISSSNPPASSLCLSKLDFILQRQSGMNNSFSSPSFCFFFNRSFSLALVFTFVFHSSFSCQSWFFISPFLLAFCFPMLRTCFAFHPVWLCDLGCRHLPVWLNFPVCVVEHIAVIRMITIWPAPLPRGAASQSIINFLHCLPLCLFIEVVWLAIFTQ